MKKVDIKCTDCAKPYEFNLDGYFTWYCICGTKNYGPDVIESRKVSVAANNPEKTLLYKCLDLCECCAGK